MLNLIDRCRWVEGHSSRCAEGIDVFKGPVEVGARFYMDDQACAAGLDISSCHAVWILNHQMCLKGQRSVRPRRGDDVGPEGEVGHEITVHDVPLNEVDTRCLKLCYLLAKSREVSREYRWCDLNGAGHGGNPSGRPSLA